MGGVALNRVFCGLGLAGVLATLAAFLAADRTPAEAAPPLDGVALKPPSYNAIHVFPVALADGTRCVAMVGEQRAGVGITCDWAARNKP